MFAHLLVPLDGSGLAEATLPYVRALIALGASRVTLLHLIEAGAPASVHGARHLTTVAEAETYLNEVAATLRARGVIIETHVDTNEGGDTAGRIVDHAAEWAVDLVVLCAHGRSGLGRWLFGSIAQKALAVGIAPIFLVLPTGSKEPRPPDFANILLPLDNSADAEVALPPAQAIGAAAHGTLHLLHVVPTVGSLSGAMASIARFSPNVTAELLDKAGEDAVAYVRGIADRLAARGLAVQAHVARADPADAIIAAAKQTRAGLVVMASHGRAGMGGAWAGSVSNKVLARTPGPFLLIRAPGAPHTLAD